MYLLYVDDSGLATDKNCKHCVLAGLAIRDTKMSRLIQLADLVAYAVFRKHEFGDDSYSSIIQGCFDKDRGQEYGLYVR